MPQRQTKQFNSGIPIKDTGVFQQWIGLRARGQFTKIILQLPVANKIVSIGRQVGRSL